MKPTTTLLTTLILVGCGAAPPPQTAPDPAAVKRVAQAIEQRDALQNQLSQVAADYRTACDVQAGDCMIQVGDRRADLLDAHSSDKCRNRASDSDAEARCVATALPTAGSEKAAKEYFEFEGWCFKQILECTAKLEAKDAERARLSRIKRRWQQLESSEKSAQLRDHVNFARERNIYLRGTLPPRAEGICGEFSDVSACTDKAEAQTEQIDAEVAKEDQDYDSKRAAALYETMKTQEAACYEPEYKCLMGKLDRYGESNETRHWLTQNLELLERREQLIGEVSSDVAKSCLDSGVSQHSSRIIQGYKQYARSPGTFFRAMLHKAFLGLHKSQVKCLTQSLSPKGATRLGG